MKPVLQTKFSLFYADGTRYSHGNCLVACLASILEVAIEEVPNIYVFYGLDGVEKNPLWFEVTNLWLSRKHRKKLVKHPLGEPTSAEYVIMRGLSKRKKPHTCIYVNEDGTLTPFFDPHPTNQFLSEEHFYLTLVDLE